MVEKRPLGRPPRGPKSGKGHVLNTRITAETRDALEAEAERTGRSLSQVAELWIDDARKGLAGYAELLGGVQVAAAIEALVRHARLVQDRIGDPTTDTLARDALLQGWRTLINKSLPFTPPSAGEIAVVEARAALRKVCEALRYALVQDQPQASSRKVAKSGRTPITETFTVTYRRGGDIPEPEEPLGIALTRVVQDQGALTDHRIHALRRQVAALVEQARPPTEAMAVLEAIDLYLPLWRALVGSRRDAAAMGQALAEAHLGREIWDREG